MGNGEWGMGNGEWGMGNGEWVVGNGEQGDKGTPWRLLGDKGEFAPPITKLPITNYPMPNALRTADAPLGETPRPHSQTYAQLPITHYPLPIYKFDKMSGNN